VLIDWQTFMSGAGVGLSDLRAEGSWRPSSSLLEADPPTHTVVREIIERVLSPKAVKILRDKFEAKARSMLSTSITEAYSQGGEGEAWDDRILAKAWDFRLQDIEIVGEP
jgi:cytochrome P450